MPSSLIHREGSCGQERFVAGAHAVVELPDLGLQAILGTPPPHAGQPDLDRHVDEDDQVGPKPAGRQASELADGLEGEPRP